ncbi:unnamed protein product [Effrenium voratum]|nr:unnamed protein product [Effrenium voratum]
MPAAVSAAERELRFALLSVFPETNLKQVSEAARCGNFDVAVEILRASLAEAAPPAAAAPEAAPEAPEAAVPEAAVPEAPEESRPEPQLPEPEQLKEALKLAEKDTLASAKKPATIQGGHLTKDGWEIKCQVDASRSCQSLRTLDSMRSLGPASKASQLVLREVGDDNTAAYAAVCFERMLQREQELDDKFCVFYHSYNGAALLYEIQAAIARQAFELEDMAPLPRVLLGHFQGARLENLKAAFSGTTLQGQDHDPWFRSLAISASPTLYAFGSEAPPLSCFRAGYGCTDLSFQNLTQQLLKEAYDLHEDQALQLVHTIADAGARFGLQVSGYCDRKRCSDTSRLGGQMLQIFVSKDIVEDYVYHCQPYGVPIDTALRPWLARPEPEKPLDGQVRILFDPEIFLDGRGKLFHYCAAWEYLGGSEEMKAMLDEQDALFERAKLQKLMEQEGLFSPMRKHVAENIRSRLKEESDKVAAEGLEMQHKCTNIRKNLGQMMNARRDLASLRRAIVGRGLESDEQSKQAMLMM